MRGSEERHCPSPSPARDHRDIARLREIEPTGLKRHNAPTTVDGEQPHMGGGVAEANASTRLKRATECNSDMGNEAATCHQVSVRTTLTRTRTDRTR